MPELPISAIVKVPETTGPSVLLVQLPRRPHGLIERLFADRSQPLGCYYLQAVLRKNAIMCDIIDLNLDPVSRVLERIGDYDVLGITTYTSQVQDCSRLVRDVRARNKDMRIICGGPDASYRPEHYLRNGLADITVIGEGEMTLLEVCQGRPLNTIAGVAFLESGTLVRTLPRERCALDVIPFPARSEHARYTSNFNEASIPSAFPIMTSRGCIGTCTYCSKSVFGRTMTYRSIENVIEEILLLMKEHKARSFIFTDDVFTCRRERVIAFCTGLFDRGINIRWTCKTRVDLVDAELLQVMKRAGCYRVEYGVEHLDADVLKKMGKFYAPEEAVRALTLTKHAGIEVVANFICRFPGSTEAKDLSMLRKIPRLPIDLLYLFLYVDYFNIDNDDLSKSSRFGLVKDALGPIMFLTDLRVFLRPRSLMRILSYYMHYPLHVLMAIYRSLLRKSWL